MFLVLKNIYKTIYNLVKDYQAIPDGPVSDRFLMGSIWKPIVILSAYLFFVLYLGPKIMEKRKPFQLRKIIMAYNVFQVIANGFCGILGIFALLHADQHVTCLNRYYATRVELIVVHCYYLLKITDLLDTIFFVLRKKYNQVSFLHVYHHTFMVFMSHIFSHFLPISHFGLIGLINCFVHVLMYSYYFMTSLNPEYSKNISWKKRITQIQIIQFAMVFVHLAIPLFSSNCILPKNVLLLGTVQNLFMILMFTDFYIRSYVQIDNKKKI